MATRDLQREDTLIKSIFKKINFGKMRQESSIHFTFRQLKSHFEDIHRKVLPQNPAAQLRCLGTSA